MTLCRVLTGAAVLLRQQVICKWRRVCETLHGGVQEARIAQVVEACSHPVHSLPLHGEFVPWKEQLLRCWDAITLTSTEAFRACKNANWFRTFYKTNTLNNSVHQDYDLSDAFVCLSVRRLTQNLLHQFPWNFVASRKKDRSVFWAVLSWAEWKGCICLHHNIFGLSWSVCSTTTFTLISRRW